MAYIKISYNEINGCSTKMKTILNTLQDLSIRFDKVYKDVNKVKDYEDVSKSIKAIQKALTDQIDILVRMRTALDSITQRYQTSETNVEKAVEGINDDFELKSVAAAMTLTDVLSKQIIAAATYIWSTLYPGDTLKQDFKEVVGYLATSDKESLVNYGANKIKDIKDMGYNVVNSAIQQVSFGTLSSKDFANITDENMAYFQSAVGAYKDNYYQLMGREDKTYIIQGDKVNNYFAGLIAEVEKKN